MKRSAAKSMRTYGSHQLVNLPKSTQQFKRLKGIICGRGPVSCGACVLSCTIELMYYMYDICTIPHECLTFVAHI